MTDAERVVLGIIRGHRHSIAKVALLALQSPARLDADIARSAVASLERRKLVRLTPSLNVTATRGAA